MVIYIDPYAGTDYADSADVVLITHQHSDHNKLTLVKRKATCTVITNADALKSGSYQHFTFDGLIVDAVPAYNVNHDKSSCVGYVLEFNGIKLYHAGDTGKITEMADLAPRKLSYALLPTDGIYTMTPEEATAAAAMINASVNIPIHTIPPPGTYSDAIVARFTPTNKQIVRPGETIPLTAASTSVKKQVRRPSGAMLHQSFPNPFNPTTTISFSLESTSHTSLDIFDNGGKHIGSLCAGNLVSGTHHYQWRASDLPTGAYYCRLITEDFVSTQKLLLIR
jgi:hypothetical protein